MKPAFVLLRFLSGAARIFPALSAAALLFAAAAASAETALAPEYDISAENLPGAEKVDPFEVEPPRERFLARNGRVFAKIYLSADGAKSGEISAALDVAEWLARVAGAKAEIPVETEIENPRSLADVPTGIYVGATRLAARLGIFAPAGLGETYVVETRGNAVFIVGKTPAATRVAAGEFLRRVLGVDFVWPGEDGAEWTPLGEIPFPRGSFSIVPAFAWRLVGVRDAAWSAHLGFGALPQFSHNLGAVFSKEIYAERPELAPEVFGARRPNFSGGYAPQPNLTSAAALDVAVAAAEKFFEGNPDEPLFSLGINDATNWDESAASEEAYGALSFFRNLPDRSDYYYGFVNRAAEKIEAVCPGKGVGVIAYMDVQNAPSFPVRGNVVPVLCADRSMWVFPEFKREDKALIRRWARSGAELWGVYDYYYGSPFLFPRLFLQEQADAIKFVAAEGGKIFYAECGPVVAFDAPKIRLASELLKNPDGDPEKILDEYYAKTFGAAAPAMKKFYDAACAVWAEQGGQCRWIKGWNNENATEIFPPEKLAVLRGHLSEALAAAARSRRENPGSARERRIAARLESVDFSLRRAEKFAASYYARKALGNAEMTDVRGTLAALGSDAWRYEEIYDDEEFRGRPHQADISAYRISDPRPAALMRALDFLKKTKNPEEKARVERALARIFEAALRSRANGVPADAAAGAPEAAADRRLRVISEAVPAFGAEPDFREDFEAENFLAYSPGDWRARKNLAHPRGWRAIVAAAEHFEMGASDAAPHGGASCFRVGGKTERMELRKSFRVVPGQKVLAQVFARGKVSCGSLSEIRIGFFDARGNALSDTGEALPVGTTPEWRRLAALDEAPPRSAFAVVMICVGLQGPGDETFFDDLTIHIF